MLIVGLRLHGACVMPGSPAVSAVRGLLTPERWRDPEPCGPLELETGLLCCMLSHSVMSNSVRPHDLSQRTTLLCPWNFPGKNLGGGCYFLLQGIFPNQGSSPSCLLHLLHWQVNPLPWSHLGSPTTEIFRRKNGRHAVVMGLYEFLSPSREPL